MENRKFACDFYSAWSQGTALYVRWSVEHGISYTELSVLYALTNNGPMTQKSICGFYGLPKQTVNGCIRRLQRDEYITMSLNKQDKREKIVALTGEGTRYSQKILAPLFQIEESVCKNISDERFVRAIQTRELFNTLFEKEMERHQK